MDSYGKFSITVHRISVHKVHGVHFGIISMFKHGKYYMTVHEPDYQWIVYFHGCPWNVYFLNGHPWTGVLS